MKKTLAVLTLALASSAAFAADRQAVSVVLNRPAQ